MLIVLHLQDAIDEGAARVYRRSAAAAGLFFYFFSFFKGLSQLRCRRCSRYIRLYQGSIKALSRLYYSDSIKALFLWRFSISAFLLLRRCQGSISDAEEALSSIKALLRSIIKALMRPS